MLTPTKPRVISWFSCGAASAVATILAAVKYGEIEAVYCRVVEEHEDNLRFLDDFTRVTGIPVKVIVDEQHEGSIYKVFAKRGFIKNQYGAPCTMILKKDMRKSYQRPTDIQVFGYTVEEQDRADRREQAGAPLAGGGGQVRYDRYGSLRKQRIRQEPRTVAHEDAQCALGSCCELRYQRMSDNCVEVRKKIAYICAPALPSVLLASRIL